MCRFLGFQGGVDCLEQGLAVFESFCVKFFFVFTLIELGVLLDGITEALHGLYIQHLGELLQRCSQLQELNTLGFIGLQMIEEELQIRAFDGHIDGSQGIKELIAVDEALALAGSTAEWNEILILLLESHGHLR